MCGVWSKWSIFLYYFYMTALVVWVNDSFWETSCQFHTCFMGLVVSIIQILAIPTYNQRWYSTTKINELIQSNNINIFLISSKSDGKLVGLPGYHDTRVLVTCQPLQNSRKYLDRCWTVHNPCVPATTSYTLSFRQKWCRNASLRWSKSFIALS